MMILGIIGGVCLVLFVVYQWKRSTSKGKSIGGMSPLESYTNTISSKINHEPRQVAKGTRDIETVKVFITDELDMLQEKIVLEFKDYMQGVILGINTHKKVVSRSASSIDTFKSKAKEFKSKFEATGKESDKLMAEKYIQKIIILTAQIEKSEKELERLRETKEVAKSEFELSILDLDISSNIISALYSSSDTGEFTFETGNLDSLTREFERLKEERDIEREVNSVVHKKNTGESVGDCEEVKSLYDSL